MREIDSDRMSGVTSRDQLRPEDREYFDTIEESRGGVRGPFRLLLNSPELAGRIGNLGAYIRFESQLPGPVRELAILTTAREFSCAYEWAAHVPIARNEGVREEAIETVADRESVTALDEIETVIVQYGRELFQEYGISDGTYRAAAEQFTDQQLVELTATMGYYGLIACILNAFEVRPDETAPRLP
jgi:4-carboxymuconolactone decarboxylase